MSRVIRIKLAELLTVHKMEQKQLAELTGVTTRAISELVNNKQKRITLDSLAKISDALEIDDISELIEIKKDTVE
ncbi:helix-turn-helix domain-containing protein [Rummeliibacillus pycnus]|uniref:helix-turn-helix domain-containing protein n=1 Tax=Rummeliibacillus pycnus TaxID=101070 RepID=UPI000C9A9BEC|nr:helix-turn-helix transcriptional regulator [Rummeliibacillus pycnus]